MLNHKGTKQLQTERLLLRKYREDDAADIYENYATDERVTEFLFWEPYSNIDDLKKFVFLQKADYSNAAYNWVIQYKGRVVGSISVTAVDETNESCEIGYCLGYELWNKGIMTEAASAVLRFLFHEVGFYRITAKHDVENAASGAVMTKCGMACEGRLREYYSRADGARSDALTYSILRHESNDMP